MWLRDAWWFMTIIVLGEDNIAACDLVNVEDTGKSIPDFITSKSGQIQQLSPDTDQSSDTDNKVNHLYTHVSTTWDSDLAMQKLRKVFLPDYLKKYKFTCDHPTTVSNGIIKITYTCRSPYSKWLSVANDGVLKSPLSLISTKQTTMPAALIVTTQNCQY